MLVPKPKDMRHKSQMFKLLIGILSDPALANNLYFKGGTCAAMRGLLERFSIDLDFDLLDKTLIPSLRPRITQLTGKLGFSLDQQSQHALQFFLKYDAPLNSRNTLKLEINDQVSSKNEYETVNLQEINLVCKTQTIGTMVANKFVAAMARLKRSGHVSGRDFYDLREFLVAGWDINYQVIEERTNQKYSSYIAELLDYVDTQLSPQELLADLNPLLPPQNFKNKIDQIIPDLKILLADELARAKERGGKK